MKVLLAAINSKYIHTNLALLYLRKMSMQAGNDHQVSIAEFNINDHSYEIMADIIEQCPDVIAFSVYIWNTDTVRRLLADLSKVLPQTKIVLGGPEVSYNAAQWLSEFGHVDYIITGGGERGWQTLLQSNFAYPSKIIAAANIPFSEVPFPYDKQMFTHTGEAVDAHRQFYQQTDNYSNRIIYYESSRGCPFRCSFCLSSREDIKLELRSLAEVKKELAFFIDRKIKLVKFVDRTFNAHPGYARAIWSFLIENNFNTCFHFEINPFLLSDEDVLLLQQVPKGCVQFEIGIQSTNPQTLAKIGRGTGQDDLRQLFEVITGRIKAIQPNIDIHLDLVFGLPCESYEEAQQSFNDVYKMKGDTFQPGMLKVLKGTEIHRQAAENGIVYQHNPPYRVLQNKWISFEQLNRFYNIEHLVNNLYNSHKFDRTLDYLERLFDSPFDLFAQLEGYWKENNKKFWVKNWIKTSKIIIDFTVDRLSEENYLPVLDCLRWDLCFNTGINSYPAFLIDKATKKLLQTWQTLKKKLRSHISEAIPLDILKNRRLIIYKPASSDFRRIYGVEDGTCYLNVSDKEGQNQVFEFKEPDLPT